MGGLEGRAVQSKLPVDVCDRERPSRAVRGASRVLPVRRDSECHLVFFQLNPPLAEEIHLRWMKSLRDEICLAAGDGGGFNFI